MFIRDILLEKIDKFQSFIPHDDLVQYVLDSSERIDDSKLIIDLTDEQEIASDVNLIKNPELKSLIIFDEKFDKDQILKKLDSFDTSNHIFIFQHQVPNGWENSFVEKDVLDEDLTGVHLAFLERRRSKNGKFISSFLEMILPSQGVFLMTQGVDCSDPNDFASRISVMKSKRVNFKQMFLDVNRKNVFNTDVISCRNLRILIGNLIFRKFSVRNEFQNFKVYDEKFLMEYREN